LTLVCTVVVLPALMTVFRREGVDPER
jgi:hypothetical protein